MPGMRIIFPEVRFDMKKHGLLDITPAYAATPGDREKRYNPPRSAKGGGRP